MKCAGRARSVDARLIGPGRPDLGAVISAGKRGRLRLRGLGKAAQRKVLAGRKPTRLSRSVGTFLRRLAERTFSEGRLNEPPRNTRLYLSLIIFFILTIFAGLAVFPWR